MRDAGLLGDPVENSPAPAIYEAAFRVLGVDATFVSRGVTRRELAAVMREVAATGGGNVTLPHKLLAAAALDTPSSSVLRTGACNCFWSGPEGSLCGDTTDVGGGLTAVHRLERSFIEEANLEWAYKQFIGDEALHRAIMMANHFIQISQEETGVPWHEDKELRREASEVYWIQLDTEAAKLSADVDKVPSGKTRKRPARKRAVRK